MSLETDLLLDRRRLKRRLFAWRIVAVLAVAAAILLVLPRAGVFPETRHVARLKVDGLITEDDRLVRAVRRLADDRQVAALIVSVNSPGGSVAGGQTLHDAIEAVAAKKPVVTVMGGLAASAGYMVSVPAARIFARGTTLTGSIGVLMETGEVSGLLSRLGVTTDAIISGPLKDQPSFTHKLSNQGREVLQGLVMDMYDQFVDMVAAGRHMDKARVRELADGRAYTGRQALPLGLVDQIGGEQDAREWLQDQKHVPMSLPVRDVETRGWAGRTFHAVLGPIWTVAAKTLLSQGVKLDGAWALWQPSAPGG